MAYVPTHPKPFMSLRLPTTVEGSARRYWAETQELGRNKDRKRRAVLKIVRSYTFVQAQRFGEVRFDELCRELNISRRSPRLSWHKALAKNAGKLLSYVDWIPDDDAALAQIAKMNADRLRDLVGSRQLHPSITAAKLKELATLEGSDA
jgi:hypothetical protein